MGLSASGNIIFQVAIAQGQIFSVPSGDWCSYGCGGSSNAEAYPAVSPYVLAIGGTTLSSSGPRILVNGAIQQVGGTSLSAPLFTGFYARIQSAKSNTLPFPAATLYQGAASKPNWFRDVISGSNGGYSAKAGWDYTTGYGSLIISNFANAFKSMATSATSSRQ